MPWYLSYVSALHGAGVQHVSSTHIAAELGLDSHQVAKDLSCLPVKGRPHIGYDTADLEHALLSALGFGTPHRAAVIGVGSLGKALIGDVGLRRYGMDIAAGFDVDPSVVGKTLDGIEVYDIMRIREVHDLEQLEIAIITVPPTAAQQAADTAMDAGFKALWNFTPHPVRKRPGVVVQNALFYTNLSVLYNQMSDKPNESVAD